MYIYRIYVSKNLRTKWVCFSKWHIHTTIFVLKYSYDIHQCILETYIDMVSRSWIIQMTIPIYLSILSIYINKWSSSLNRTATYILTHTHTHIYIYIYIYIYTYLEPQVVLLNDSFFAKRAVYILGSVLDSDAATRAACDSAAATLYSRERQDMKTSIRQITVRLCVRLKFLLSHVTTGPYIYIYIYINTYDS